MPTGKDWNSRCSTLLSGRSADISPRISRQDRPAQLQTNNLYFDIKNTGSNWATSQLTLDASDLPDGARFQLHIERHPEMEAAWNSICPTLGSTSPVACFIHQDIYVLEIVGGMGVSPTGPMPPVSQLATVTGYEMPAGSHGTVVISHQRDGVTVGGMSFQLSGSAIIR
jgi:hypothetical protein